MDAYEHILKAKIDNELFVLLLIVAFCVLLSVTAIVQIKKKRSKTAVASLIFICLFSIFILYSVGAPLALVSYDYLAGSKFIELTGVVDDITGDHTNEYVIINSVKYNLPDELDSGVKAGDVVAIVFAEKSKYIVDIEID